MAFDETYNEPENVEVLVKSLNPDQPAELYYAMPGMRVPICVPRRKSR